jgi:hypothetical protein
LLHPASITYDNDEQEDEEGTGIERNSYPHSCSISPGRCGSVDKSTIRRQRASSSPSLHETQIPRSNSNSRRPKADDYDDTTQEFIYRAIAIYHVKLSTLLPFPSHQDQIVEVRDSWKTACEELDKVLHLTPCITKLASTI